MNKIFKATIVAATLIAAGSVSASAQQFAVWLDGNTTPGGGGNPILTEIDHYFGPGHYTLVTTAQLETPGFLDAFDTVVVSRFDAQFGTALSAAAAANIQAYVGTGATQGGVALFTNDIADNLFGTSGFDPYDPNLDALFKNALTFAAASHHGYIGEFNGAVMGVTANTAGFPALGLLPGTASPVHAYGPQFVYDVGPIGSGNPIDTGVTFPFTDSDNTTFLTDITGADPSNIVDIYTSPGIAGEPAVLANQVVISGGCAFDLAVEVGYEFGGTGTSGLYTATPDSAFVIIKNNGTADFVGELRLDGIAGAGTDVHDTSGAGYVLAPGASFRLEAGPESSNQGGFNKQACADNGLLLSINGTTHGVEIHYQIYDKDIHSGVFAVNPFGVNLDNYILQGGDPLGRDTGDAFEVPQAHATFHIAGGCEDACALTCPGDIAVCNDPGQCGAVVSYSTPNLIGLCSGATVQCSVNSGSFFPVGTTTVDCTATAADGSSIGQCSFNITVTDNDNSCCAFTCPSNITVCNDLGVCGAAVTYPPPTVTGSCAVTCTPASGSLFEVGTTTVTCTADNGTSCSFSVTVNDCATQCPLSQGYWKNHAEAWPVTTLTLGTLSYSKAELLTILQTPVGAGKGADASLILAHQLIAAKLNLLHGSDPCPISSTIAAADALIGSRHIPISPKIAPSTTEGSQMGSLASILDSYNNGVLTPNCTP